MLNFLSPKVRTLAASLSVGLLAALAACSDGSSVATAPAAAPPAADAPIAASGTAALGAPLANATVSLLCGKGGAPTTAKTLADGTFGMSLDSGCAAPYLLKVVGVDTSVTPNATVTLFAFADAAGNINITPLTDIAAGIITGGDTSSLYDAVVQASKKVSDSYTDAAKADALTKLKAKLTDLGLGGDAAKVTVDLLQGKFKADGNDPLDALLDKLKAVRGSVPLSSLVESIVQAGGQPGTTPWNVLFPPGASSVTLVGTGCTYQYPNPAYMPSVPGITYTYAPPTLSTVLAGSVTVTLTKGTSTLGISGSSGTTLFAISPFGLGGPNGGNFHFGLLNTGWESVGAGNETSNFSYSNNVAKSTLAGLESPQGVAGTSFQINTGNTLPTTYLICQTATPLAAGKFDLPTRAATLVAATTSAVVSPSAPSYCQSQTYNFSTSSYIYGTYTYSVSPLGDVKFNGTSLPSAFPSSAANYYYESTNFDQATGQPTTAFMSIVGDNPSNTGVTLTRNYPAAGTGLTPFSNACGGS